jgi:hypothetical protein
MPSAKSRSKSPELSAVLGHGDLATSLLFIFPLLLIYEAAVIFSPVANGVDFVSRNLFALVGHSKANYLTVHLVLGVGFVGLLYWLKTKRRFRGAKTFLPMFLESAVWALALGSLIVFVMRDLLGIDPELSISGAAQNIMLSFGAGVHEELVFRLGLCAGGAALLRLGGISHTPSVIFAFLVSSAAFSAAHHIGSLGDPWALGVFLYRFLAGLIFAALFYYRSLAHAVYAHALYDVYVLVLQ